MNGLAIVTPGKPQISETFINAHIEYLKPSSIYYGGKIPLIHNDQPIQSFIIRGVRRVIGHLLKKPIWHDEFAFKKSLKKNNVKVILAEYGTQGADIVPICKSLNIKLIVHFHGYDASMNSTLKVYESQYKQLFDYASHVMAVSEVMKNDLSTLGCDPAKVVKNPYGPNESFFNIQPNYASLNILAVGRLVDKKAPYYLILAVKEFISKYSKLKLTIVGDGPLFGVCKDLIGYFRLNDHITLAGTKTPDEIKAYMSQSSVFVQHSVQAESGDKEGSPVAIMEAAASGLPIVATRHAGIPETVLDQKTGFLVDEHEVEGFTLKLAELLESNEKRKNMGESGRTHIKEKFTMEKHIGVLKVLVTKSVNHV